MPMPRGFSLVELMLAMALGLLLCALLLPVLLATLDSQRFALQRLDAQQEARFVLQQLGHDLRMAGSFGCAGPAQWPAEQGSALPLVDTDSVTLRYAVQGVALLAGAVAAEGSMRRLALLQTPPAWEEGQPLLLSSCTRIDPLVLGQQAWLEQQGGQVWLRLEGHSPAALNLSRHHLLSLTLLALEQRQYRLDTQGGLWLQQGSAPEQLLASGIASLRLQVTPQTVCVAGLRRWWWTVQLGMQAGPEQAALPEYVMQLASRMGMPCPA